MHKERGKEEANRLAHECFEVEESEHWPCKAANSCRDVEGAISQGCKDLYSTLKSHPLLRNKWHQFPALHEPKFCKRYIRP